MPEASCKAFASGALLREIELGNPPGPNWTVDPLTEKVQFVVWLRTLFTVFGGPGLDCTATVNWQRRKDGGAWETIVSVPGVQPLVWATLQEVLTFSGFYEYRVEYIYDGAPWYSVNELEITATNAAPTIAAGATVVSASPINRLGANTTDFSVPFTDTDEHHLSWFSVTLKIREPNNLTEHILIENKKNGQDGLTVVDNGGGSYEAQYTYDPPDGIQVGLYDLYSRVADRELADEDPFSNNLDELEIGEPPSVVAGATQVSVSKVDRLGANTTTISTTFSDIDEPAVSAFTVTIKIREPNDTTELTLVNAAAHGEQGLTIVDNGGGSYTASFVYNPDDAQTLGFYDLYFEVSDSLGTAIDGYANNVDELEIVASPTIVAGATQVSVSPLDRVGNNATVISADFSDADQPAITAFTVTIKIREPDNSTELILVNAAQHGQDGLTIVDNGGGSYTASVSYNPIDTQTVGLYDLFFEVSDDIGTATDGYANNLDELEIVARPTVVAGATQVSVSPVNRIGAATTTISAQFFDADQPGILAFTVTFKIREPNDTTELVLVNALTHGVGGLVITDNGGGLYTASFVYNPSDTQTLGLYDLFFEVSDSIGTATDGYANNVDELQILTSPIIATGATQVSLSPIDRFGAIQTVVSCDFTDPAEPGVGAFTTTFKIREPDNFTEHVLVVDKGFRPFGGPTIVDNGGGSYTASIPYDPPTDRPVGAYDLFFEVTNAVATATDGYANNPDELVVVERPIIVSGATQVSASPVNRLGVSTTTISVTFTDADQPAVSAFTITFKIREPNNVTEHILVNALTNGNGGLLVQDNGGGSYTASYVYDPPDGLALGFYDLFSEVVDSIGTATDGFANNLDELEIIETPIGPTDVVGTLDEFLENVPGFRLATFMETNERIKSIFQDPYKQTVGASGRAPELLVEEGLIAISHGSTVTLSDSATTWKVRKIRPRGRFGPTGVGNLLSLALEEQ
jgi:hypothetical protein